MSLSIVSNPNQLHCSADSIRLRNRGAPTTATTYGSPELLSAFPNSIGRLHHDGRSSDQTSQVAFSDGLVPLPQAAAPLWRSPKRLDHSPVDCSQDIPLVFTRPALRPTASFGNRSTMSFYSTTSSVLDLKSRTIAMEEEKSLTNQRNPTGWQSFTSSLRYLTCGCL